MHFFLAQVEISINTTLNDLLLIINGQRFFWCRKIVNLKGKAGFIVGLIIFQLLFIGVGSIAWFVWQALPKGPTILTAMIMGNIWVAFSIKKDLMERREFKTI